MSMGEFFCLKEIVKLLERIALALEVMNKERR